MNEKALQTLEFNKILKMLSDKAVSQIAKERSLKLKPVNDLDEIRSTQKETTEAVSMILKKGSLPLGGIKDIRGVLKRCVIGGTLSIQELLYVGDFLYVSKKLCNYVKGESKIVIHDMLDPQFAMIGTAPELEREIDRCIVNEQEIADDASNALYDVRRQIRSSNEKIKEHLNGIIHSQNYKNMLQDNVITIRNDRYCVPIKAEYRGSFPGMVHDQSSTGATVFIEPMSVVQLNNKIKELRANEKNEIEKILIKMSGMVAEQADLLNTNIEIITYLDFVFAKGELSISMDASEPMFNTNGYINIRKGRHPLLDKQTVVPTDIYLGKDFTTLLITGPNTGGKTVSLKTIGIFTLMGQAGLHISAFDSSELNVFENVFADIGDEQSIEQSLSTFSSHMTNIVSILQHVTDNSLVLLDELGAGTDPTEGAALAIAILQYLHVRKIRAAVTTHYSELKVYALSEQGVMNASCEFDVESLRPTYKLLIGIPGKSNAFAISQKLGLPDFVISAAKDVISREAVRFEDVITDLEISRKTISLEQERAEQYRLEAERMKKELDFQNKRLAAQREKILQEAKEESRRITLSAKEEADSLIKEMHNQLKNSAYKEMEETRKIIKTKLSETGNNDTGLLAESGETLTNLNKGDKVLISSMNRSGIVLSPPNSEGEVMVQAGIMKIKVNINTLSLDKQEETVKVNSRPLSHAVKSGKSRNISPEIDLRGCIVSEGLEQTDKYLDNAYLSGLAQISIIHGKGTGALRTAIQNHLKNHPHVKNYRYGKFGEGEMGVTIVELK